LADPDTTFREVNHAMRTSKGYRWLLCAAALGSIAGVAAPAAADDLAINRFYPAPAGDRLFGVQSAFVNGDLTPHAGLIIDYAHNPLVLRRTSTDENLGAVVSNQLYLHLNGSLALFERLLVNVDVPVALFQSGDNPANGFGIESPSGADFGDLRLGLRLRVLGDYDSLFQLAIGGYVWLPTGSGAYVTDGSARGLPQVILGGKHDRFVYSAAVGPEIRPDREQPALLAPQRVDSALRAAPRQRRRPRRALPKRRQPGQLARHLLAERRGLR